MLTGKINNIVSILENIICVHLYVYMFLTYNCKIKCSSTYDKYYITLK